MTAGSPLTHPERPAGRPVPSASDARRWPVTLAVPIVVGALLAGIVVYTLAAAVRQGLMTPDAPQGGTSGVAVHGSPPVLTLLGTFAQDVALIIGVGLAVAFSSGRRLRPRLLGLRPARVASSAGWVVLAYVVFLLVSAGWTSALGITERENIPVDLGTRDSAGALIGALVLVCAMAPLAEELFFRGFLFGGLRRHGLVLAAGVSGLLFGLAHVASSPIGFLVPLAVLGVLLCLLYEKTGSLYPPIALHCLNNSIAFGAGDGRAWLVGVCLVACGGVIVVLLRLANRTFAEPRPAG